MRSLYTHVADQTNYKIPYVQLYIYVKEVQDKTTIRMKSTAKQTTATLHVLIWHLALFYRKMFSVAFHAPSSANFTYNPLTDWRPLSPHGYSYKASCRLPDRVKPSFVFLTSGHSDALGWAPECPDVKNYKWRLNPAWHKMLYSCTHVATSGHQRVNDIQTKLL